MTAPPRVAYVIGFSAPPVLHLDEFLVLLAERGWDTYVILSPTAATWVDSKRLAEISGHPVRVQPRAPQDDDPLPPAQTVIAAPLTFNSLNKWTSGISDTLALGLLNEALGLDLTIVAAPCIKGALRRHPVYGTNFERLASAGVRMLDPDKVAARSRIATTNLDWRAVLASLCGPNA
jgi:phosphopantothenoylcysteine synthetase/decarboxylase